MEWGLWVVDWGLTLLPVLELMSDVILSELGSRLDGRNMGLYVILRLDRPLSLPEDTETENIVMKRNLT